MISNMSPIAPYCCFSFIHAPLLPPPSTSSLGSSLSPLYFPAWDCSIYHNGFFFCCLATSTMSGRLVFTIPSVWIWKSIRMLAWSFSATFGGAARYGLQTSSPYWAQMILFTMTATLFPLTYRLHHTLL